MKLSTRPFMVEIKNRKRAASPAASSFTRRDDRLDPICPDALPQRDGHEGLTVAPAQSQALREAEKVFQGLRGSGQTAPAESEPTTAAISSESQVVTPRVLPDLRTAAGEAKREDVRQPRRNGAANRSTEGQPRKKVSAKPLRVPAAGPIIEPAPACQLSPHGAPTNPELTLTPDHSSGADQSEVRRSAHLRLSTGSCSLASPSR